jgi:hypothetical protein
MSRTEFRVSHVRWIVELPTQRQRHFVVAEVVNAGPAVDRLDNEPDSVPAMDRDRDLRQRIDPFVAFGGRHATERFLCVSRKPFTGFPVHQTKGSKHPTTRAFIKEAHAVFNARYVC